MSKDCKAFCIARRFDFGALKEDLTARERAIAYKGLLQLEKWEGLAFIFDFGVVVLWNLSHDQSKSILDALAKHCIDPLPHPIEDNFTFETGAARTRIQDDHIELDSEDSLPKISISHGIAQSVKLSEFEGYADDSIQNTREIPKRIARTGASGMNRLQISRMCGQLFLVSSGITENVNLLDTPEFFWEYPEFETPYLMMARYLEVRNRLEILEKRLQVIHELFSMLADEQRYRHSAILEWVIIGLIASEFAGFLMHDVFKIV